MKGTKWLIGLFALMLLASLGAGEARAAPFAEKSVTVERREMDFTILPNGNVRVQETWQVAFHGGAFTYAFREIPFNHVEAITDWNVAEGKRRYLHAASGSQPYTYTLTTSATGEKIVWYFPPTTNATRTFTLSYTLRGALWIDARGDQFFWKAIESDRSYTIQHAEATIHLPGTFSQSDLRTTTYENGHSSGGGTLREDNTLYFQAGPFPGGTEWEIRVQWPHGHVDASPPSWQRQMQIQPWINLGWALLLFLLVAGSIGGGFLLWYLRGRDPKVAHVPGIISQPPSNLPPGMVGTLIDEVADMDDILATLLDLAQRGFLRIEIQRQKKLLFKTVEKVDFVAQASWPEPLLPYERRLLEAIFGFAAFSGERRSLDSLKKHFYPHLSRIYADLYKSVVAAGLFPTDPEDVRTRYILLAILMGSVISALAWPGKWTGANFMGTVAPLVGIPVGLALLLLARVMPRKTRQGALEAAKWRAFERYLRKLEHHTALEQARDLFERYLPYAAAFGIAKLWIRKFAHLPNMPTPPWYIVPPAGGDPLGAPAQGGMPSLNSMAGGATTSFSDMADSLINTLNSAAATLGSSPGSGGGGGGGGGGGSSGFG